MSSPKGEFKVKAGGKAYRLHLGMSALADLQAEFGSDFESALSAPGEGRLPNFRVIHAIVMAALQRYHADETDRYTVDDILAENVNMFGDLLAAAFPDPDGSKDKSAGNAEKEVGEDRAAA